MNIVQFWELIDDATQSFINRRLHKFDFSHVKLSDSSDFEPSSNLSWCLSLCFTQGDVDEFIGIRDFGDTLEIIAHYYNKVVFFENNYKILLFYF
jgi:hypothetical protein